MPTNISDTIETSSIKYLRTKTSEITKTITCTRKKTKIAPSTRYDYENNEYSDIETPIQDENIENNDKNNETNIIDIDLKCLIS